jgi:hypothetical protein
MTVERVLETYEATSGIYREFSLPAGPLRAIDLARSLREAGLPAQAYMLVEGTQAADLGFPFIYGDKSRWKLYLPPGINAYGLGEEVILPSDQVIKEGAAIVGEPPVGRRFQLMEGELIAQSSDHRVDVFIFYAATNDKPELAEEQLFDELTGMLERARQAGREVIFLDACGLIREKTVKNYQTATRDEKAAFEKVFNEIRDEAEAIGQGHAPYETGSPLWSALHRFLAERRVRSVLEELDYELWKQIVDFDRQNLMGKAFTEFLSGFPEDAAQTMLQHMHGFHQLNCLERDRRLMQQIEHLMENFDHPLFLIGRELGHYGVLESLLSERYSVHSKILGKERLSVLLKQPALGSSLLWNIGVKPSEEELELMALRYCLKATVLRGAVKDLRAMAKALVSSRIDNLSRDEIEQILNELNDSTRVYLRSRGQDIAEQLIYLLKDKEIVPEDMLKALQSQ